jgi:isopenicillin-N N-acyltransferase like protein
MRGSTAIVASALTVCIFCAPRRPLAPPPYPPPPAAVDERDGIGRLGESFLRQRQGIREARFVGNAYTRGYARGRLAYAQIVQAERDLRGLLERFVPPGVKRLVLNTVIAANLRASIPEIPAEHVEEIAGVSDALSPDPFPDDWNPFARQLAMHALHDFSQRFVDDTPLAAACTAFAASGRATADGHTLMARNFDFEAGEAFDREKIVAYVVPKEGIPYLSVTFASLTGVTSGFNREGIGIFVNAWSAGETGSSGEPATLVAADVLERARTLSDAIGILEKASVFVSDFFVLADGKTGEMAVVEKSPSRTAVRRSSEWIAAANHPESPELGSSRLAATSTSFYRRERIEEMLRLGFGRIDARFAVRALRDRSGRGGRELGPGNRNAVNALISSHSVVFDLAARRAWVSAGPHGLGHFAVYALELGIRADPADVRFADLAADTIPADPWLASGGYADYEKARGLVAAGRKVLRAKRPAQALVLAREALSCAPGLVEALALAGEALAAAGDTAGADRELAAALERDPAPPPFARSLAGFRAALAAGRRPAEPLAYPLALKN